MNSASPITLADIDTLDFAKAGGLVPAIVQDADSGAVLMLGYMNAPALRATLERGRVVFFSRSKARLWEKGETSGNYLELVDARSDCDKDALLVRARAQGAVCHLGTRSCFADAPATAAEGLAFLAILEKLIESRIAEMQARGEPLRPDDDPYVLHRRLMAYREQTAPLIAYYRRHEVLRSVDGMADPNQVTAAIERLLAAPAAGPTRG